MKLWLISSFLGPKLFDENFANNFSFHLVAAVGAISSIGLW